MKRMALLFACTLTAWSALGQPVEWFVDQDAALAKAKRENKAVLLDFTGSDWCGWCMKLKKEVFDQPEFENYARANLVLVEVDFPRHIALSPALIEANQRLAETYGIQGYPTIIVLDSDGRKLGQAGYMRGGPKAFNAAIQRIIVSSRSKSVQPDDRLAKDPGAKPADSVLKVPVKSNSYDKLSLMGLSGPKTRRLAVINGETFMAGDTAMVTVGDKRLAVCCKEIRDTSALVTVDDGAPVELKFGR